MSSCYDVCYTNYMDKLRQMNSAYRIFTCHERRQFGHDAKITFERCERRCFEIQMDEKDKK